MTEETLMELQEFFRNNRRILEQLIECKAGEHISDYIQRSIRLSSDLGFGFSIYFNDVELYVRPKSCATDIRFIYDMKKENKRLRDQLRQRSQ